MSRSGESITRVDVRFPNSIYAAVQHLAVNDGARTHHISQKVEVSPTIVKLVLLGLDALVGKLPDNTSEISDSLPDKSISIVSARNSNISDISDISDKRIESIVDKRLAELGLFPDCQTEHNSPSYSLPDKSGILPDTLPDSNIAVSDKVASIPDNLPDTENIPSDDSSNSDSIVEDVQVIQTDVIEQISRDFPTSFSYSEFHKWVGIPVSTPNKANGDIAITIAKDKGLGDWNMNSKSRKFTKSNEDNPLSFN